MKNDNYIYSNPKKEMGRNERCWCGSGKKWKNCHKDRHLQKPDPIGKINHELIKQLNTGFCLHPDAPHKCGGEVVQSHTIQKSKGISFIADKGHVLSLKSAFNNHNKISQGLSPEPVGLRTASTFMGFCSYHDNSTFETIEKIDPELNYQTAFLLGYRSICYEYLMKYNAINTYEISCNLDKGKSFDEQVEIQTYLQQNLGGLRKGFQDVQSWKSIYDVWLKNKSYSQLQFYAIEFDQLLPIVCSGAFHPEVDLNGIFLQNLGDITTITEYVCLNITAFNKRTILILSWHLNNTGVASQFVRSFLNAQQNEKANLALIIAFEQLENTYISPKWWGSLSSAHKSHLLKRMESGLISKSMRVLNTYLNPPKIIQDYKITKEIINFS